MGVGMQRSVTLSYLEGVSVMLLTHTLNVTLGNKEILQFYDLILIILY